MSNSPRPILVLYSHGRSPPLYPSPDLKYDLRNIPNPPKALRDGSDGRSKRLREHLLSNSKFITRLELVEWEIHNAMEAKIAEYEARAKKIMALEDMHSEEVATGRMQEEGMQPKNSASDTGSNEDGDDMTENVEVDHSDTSSSREDEILLRVGCSCALGHHRSVAFVHELSQRQWPKDWQIHAVHRDLEKKRAGGARKAQKVGWKGKDRKLVGDMENGE